MTSPATSYPASMRLYEAALATLTPDDAKRFAEFCGGRRGFVDKMVESSRELLARMGLTSPEEGRPMYDYLGSVGLSMLFEQAGVTPVDERILRERRDVS